MMKLIHTVVLLLVIPGRASAEIIFQPPGLERGDRYRIVFVTSEVRDATSHDIDVYNDFVQSVADAAPIVGDWGLEWRAVASTEEVNAIDNVGYVPFGTNNNEDLLPIYRVDGVEFTAAERGLIPELFGGDSITPILKTELNAILPQEATEASVGANGGTVWTGSSGSGFTWTGDALGSNRWARVGGSGSTGLNVLNSGRDRVTNEHHFYALSEVITVVPEPSSSILAFCGILLLCKRRSRKGSRS